MKSPFVKELEPNSTITGLFLVSNKEIRQKKTGEPYLSLILSDKTGELDSKMWDNVAEVMDTFERDDFVKVKGLIQIFHNRPQLTIHKLRRLDESEIEFADYFPASERDPEDMWRELRANVSGIGNPHLRALLDNILDDPEIAVRYKIAPAAKTIHHAYLSGLLEHVLSLCSLARLVSSHYQCLDFDLLLTGVVLHDLGKIYELTYDRGFGYSDDGQLLGHIAMGLRMVGDKMREIPGFPPPLRNLVEHMILSHHGKLEFGSPKLPCFQEALVLHYIDDLDSKMECMRVSVANDRQVEGSFTGFVSSMERVILKKARYLDGPPPAPVQPKTPEVVAAVAPESSHPQPPRPSTPPAPQHPLFTPKGPSVFGDKLMQALRGNAKQEQE